MKNLVILLVLVMSSMSFAAAEWKVVAETENCSEKAQVMAREGEKYVVVTMGERKEKLFSEDGSVYSADSKKSVDFKSDSSSEKSFVFTQPSMMEANPPKLGVFEDGKKARCRMALK